MKKFSFRFETVLKVRRLREEEGLRSLSTAQRAHQAELARKAKLVAALETSLRRREEAGVESERSNRSIVMPALELEQKFIMGCKQRIAQAEQAITRAGRSVEKALRAYLYLKRQTKMIEILYEKDFAEHKKWQSRKEARAQDELATMRSFYKSRSRESA